MIRLLINNVNTKLVAESTSDLQTIELIDQFLTVEVTGAKHSTAYKIGRWDGTKHFLNKRNNMFLTGFLPSVIKLLDDSLIAYEIEDIRENLPKFLPVDTTLGEFTLRDYQYDFVVKANRYLDNGLYFPRGIIDGATNAGKSIIFASIINSIDNCKALITIHSKTIFNQLYNYFVPLYGRIGRINDQYYDVQDVTIAMVQTLAKRLSDDNSPALEHLANSFNTLIVDECHRAGSTQYNTVLNSINAGAIYFCSGTPLQNDDFVKNMYILGHSGPKIGSVSNEYLIEIGVSRKPKVYIHLNPEPPAYYSTYQEEAKAQIECSELRTQEILSIIADRTDSYILISCSIIEHGNALLKAIQSRFSFLRTAFIHGKSFDREYRLKDFNEGKLEVLISSMIIKEGVNIPNIDCLIRADGGKSIITTKQLCGRTLRAKEGSDAVEIHDFYDRGKWVSKHSEDRIKIYQKEGFEIEFLYNHKNFKPI